MKVLILLGLGVVAFQIFRRPAKRTLAPLPALVVTEAQRAEAFARSQEQEQVTGLAEAPPETNTRRSLESFSGRGTPA